MSYLKQKKQKKNEDYIFLILAVFLAITTFSVFSNSLLAISLNNFRLQTYLLNAIFLIFSLFKKRILYFFASLLFLFINYSALTAYANIIKNKEVETNNTIEVEYKNKASDEINFIQKEDIAIVLINFSQTKNLKDSLETLKAFILSHNTPVIIIGDFSKPLWHPLLKDFMQKTGLNAKNKLIFDDFGLLYVPTINVLGFDNIGIKEIIKKNNGFEFILLAK